MKDFSPPRSTSVISSLDHSTKNRERGGRQASFVPPPHGLVRGFDLTGKTRRVEERRRRAMARELPFDLRNKPRVAGEFERRAFVVFQRGHGEFRDPGGFDEARGDAAG